MTSRPLRSLVYWLLLSPLVLVILFPFAVMVSTAVKPRAEILRTPPSWLSSELRLQNFIDMWHAVGFGPALLNSALVSAAATALCVLVAIPAAYAGARMRFRGEGAFRQFLLITQMLSPIVLVLGIFRLMAGMGLVDQLWALVLAYAAFNLAFAIWMLQSYFRTIPVELEEAAWLDGATALQSLRLIFLPMAAPALGVTAIFVFIYCWNEFVLALDPAPLDRQVHPHHPDLLAGRRPLLGRVGPRDGGNPARQRARGGHLRRPPALPRPRPGPRQREVALRTSCGFEHGDPFHAGPRLGRGAVAQGRVQALPVVEDLDVLEHGRPRLLAGAEAGSVDVLLLQRGEEALHRARCRGSSRAGSSIA